MGGRRRWHGRLSPWIGALFGLFGGIYTALTGDYLTWRTYGDPLLPMNALFDSHPLLGIAVFTLIGFAAGWIIRWIERLKP
jgi:H+/Cl- antiporter ClcA